MRWWFKPLLGVIVIFELAIVSAASYKIYLQVRHHGFVLGAKTIVPVDKRTLLFTPTGDFKYFYEPKPNTVYSEKPDWLAKPATHTINADSLNDARNYSVTKPPGVFRIIALGDSFTFGQYVNTSEAWPTLLEKTLNSGACKTGTTYEVLNLGVEGYDVDYIAHRYVVRGMKYDPDLIVWFESGTGFDRTIELMSPIEDALHRTLTQKQLAEYRSQVNEDPVFSLAQKEVHTTYSDAYIANLISGWWKAFFAARGNVPVLVDSVTDVWDKGKTYLTTWAGGQPDVHVAFDIPTFSGTNSLLPDGHPNPYGHERIASAIFSRLVQQKLIPCTATVNE